MAEGLPRLPTRQASAANGEVRLAAGCPTLIDIRTGSDGIARLPLLLPLRRLPRLLRLLWRLALGLHKPCGAGLAPDCEAWRYGAAGLWDGEAPLASSPASLGAAGLGAANAANGDCRLLVRAAEGAAALLGTAWLAVECSCGMPGPAKPLLTASTELLPPPPLPSAAGRCGCCGVRGGRPERCRCGVAAPADACAAPAVPTPAVPAVPAVVPAAACSAACCAASIATMTSLEGMRGTPGGRRVGGSLVSNSSTSEAVGRSDGSSDTQARCSAATSAGHCSGARRGPICPRRARLPLHRRRGAQARHLVTSGWRPPLQNRIA